MQSKTYNNIMHFEDKKKKKKKKKKNYSLRVTRARLFSIGEKKTLGERTNQIRGFPTEYSWISANKSY